MSIPYIEQTAAAMSSTLAGATHEESEHKLFDFLYQAATVAAIFLFLISFWSC